MNIKPFQIAVLDSAVTDLHDRLARTRWPEEVNDDDWSYGARLPWLRRVMDYWRDGYDWRVAEAGLNALPQFKADIDGLEVHFIHAKGKGPSPLPILISHGWPGSYTELLDIVPLLTNPAAHGGDAADSFDVIIPSMPGYGFSQQPKSPGMTPLKTAHMWAKLMAGLGYDRYVVQGGDWGATVSTWLAWKYPEHVAAIHLNWVPGSLQPPLGDGQRPLSDAEQAFLNKMMANLSSSSSHVTIHAARPQTLAYALNDSPVGLAAWLLDKFRMISDCDGDLEKIYTLDTLLTNVSVYWFTGSIGSAIRLYKESQSAPVRFAAGEKVKPPLGYALFRHEVALPPREWLERCYDVRRWTEYPRGGHFAAMEQPQALAEDIRAFCREFRLRS